MNKLRDMRFLQAAGSSPFQGFDQAFGSTSPAPATPRLNMSASGSISFTVCNSLAHSEARMVQETEIRAEVAKGVEEALVKYADLWRELAKY